MADTEDTETLAQAMCHEQGGIWTFIRQARRDTYLRNARAVLASSWLAARDERIRGDEREKLATEDMREVVARALWLDANPRPADWDTWPEWDREGFRNTAAVALRALAGEVEAQ